MLSTAERAWLEQEAEDMLGLSKKRVQTLLAVLGREQFSLREIGRATHQTSEGIRAALDTLVARQLIEFYPVGATRGSKAAYHAEVGERLRFLLDAVRALRHSE